MNIFDNICFLLFFLATTSLHLHIYEKDQVVNRNFLIINIIMELENDTGIIIRNNNKRRRTLLQWIRNSLPFLCAPFWEQFPARFLAPSEANWKPSTSASMLLHRIYNLNRFPVTAKFRAAISFIQISAQQPLLRRAPCPLRSPCSFFSWKLKFIMNFVNVFHSYSFFLCVFFSYF